MSLSSELRRFLVTGFTTVAIDFFVYICLMKLGLSTVSAKALGFICGMVFAYFANRLWTFSGAKGGHAVFARFILVYATNLVVNVSVNAGMLLLLARIEAKVFAAFVVATGISASLNFIGMKYVAFRKLS